MEKQEVGRFYAVSFNDIVLEFIVFDDYTMACPALGIDSFRYMLLKPRFILSGDGLYYTYKVKAKEKYTSPQELIARYDMDEELFYFLKDNYMIRYSTDMAYFYGFPDINGYDRNRDGVRSPYKWAKKKGPILVKQRRGQFN